ncbi:MAG: diguanylate cyclase [Gemmatimonadaceae bacterium]
MYGPIIDDLTKLPLRGAFLETASAAASDARSLGAPLALLVIDVDHFKLVNDTFGHLQGDDVLRAVADMIRGGLRAGDTAGRYAGDEFVALLPGTDVAAARDVADRICAAVRGHTFPIRGRAGSIPVTLSIGVATYPEHGDGVDALFASADRALYQVKRAGRDGAAVAPAPGTEPGPIPLAIERFVGRVDELRSLIRLLDRAASGRPQLVAIGGEAGVGKTTLIRQLEPEVRLRAGSLIVGRCQEGNVQPPYGPWAEIIASLRRIDASPPREWRELPHLVPALGPWVDTAGGRGSKYLLLAEIAEYIRVAAAQRPIVLVLDDMQWADSASWDALEHLVPQLTDERVLICLTLRAEEAGGEARERRQRLSRDERFHEITVSRLTRDEMKAWVEAAFHRQDVGRELLAFLYRHTEGNALFVVQVLRTLLDEGAIWHTGERWEWRPVSELRLPVAITDLISRRLARLSSSAHDILTTAAVIGREFDVDLAIEAGAGTEDDLLDAVDEALDAAVLQPTTTRGGDRYAFTHDKLAEVLRAAVNPRRLRRLHLRVARALERRTPDAISEIVTHYDRGEDRVNAYRCALVAAERAKVVYAHEEGTAFLRIAERNAGSPADLAEVRVRLAEVAEAVGRYEEAEELCDLAIEWFAAQSDAQRAIALRRARVRLRGLLGQPAYETLEACLALDGVAREMALDAERVSLLTMISQLHGRLGDDDSAAYVARECVALAERVGDATLLAESLNRLGITLLQDHASDAAGVCRRALDLFRRAGDARGQANCHNNLAIIHMMRGEWRAAQRELRAALPLGHRTGAPDLCGLLLLNLGVVHQKCGEYDHARELCGEALAMFAGVKNPERQLYALYNLAHIDRESGRLASAAELYEVVRGLAHRIGQADVEVGAAAGRGLALLAQGQVDAARAECLQSETWLRARPDWFQGRELLESLAIRLAAHEGRVADAAEQLDRACALADGSDVHSAIWLTVECAEVLLEHDPACAAAALGRYAERVRELDYEILSRRYGEVLARAEASQIGRPGSRAVA